VIVLNLEYAGMVVSINIGYATDIPPKNKQKLGIRLALQAKAQTYGRNVTY